MSRGPEAVTCLGVAVDEGSGEVTASCKTDLQ